MQATSSRLSTHSATLLSLVEYLFVGNTGFAGHFPELPVGTLEADFAYTLIHKGFDDAAFGFAPLLEYLNLGGNNLNTTLPPSLATHQNLKFLYIHDCFLRGGVEFLSGMPSIFELWIDGNFVEGSLPEDIGNATTLASLSLTDNYLNGTIPLSIGNMTNLQQMWLYDNSLEGPIPTELGSLIQLKTLYLEGNDIENESMPDEICFNTGAFGKLDVLGADCHDAAVACACCTCCGLHECQPDLYPVTASPTAAPIHNFDVNATFFSSP